MRNYTDSICLTFLHFVFQMFSQVACLWGCKVTLIAFVWLFSNVFFHVCLQSTFIRWCIVTLVAFVWLFSSVFFHVCYQTVCPRRGKVTLDAFVWLFSIVRFQMSLQISCLIGCIVTLAAFVWLFPSWIFYIGPALLQKILIHHQHLKCVVSCVRIGSNWNQMHGKGKVNIALKCEYSEWSIF